jgi:hypothetical protein
MGISVIKTGDRYKVAVSPPEGANWQSSAPLTATQVLERLGALGCHSTDITDPLYAADPSWAEAHDAEVRHRRRQAEDAT